MKKVWFTSLILLLLVEIVSHPQCQAQDAKGGIQDILDGLAQHPNQITSAHFVFDDVHLHTPDYHRVMNSPQGSSPEPQVAQMEWAFKGEKVYRKVLMHNASSNPAVNKYQFEQASIFDGEDRHDLHSGVTYSGRHANLGYVRSSKKKDYTSPLMFGLQSGGKWIIDVLHNGQYSLEGTVQDPKFGDLSVVHWQNASGARKRFWFAPRYGFLAVRIETEPATGGQIMTFQCNEVEKQAGIWFSSKGTKELQIMQSGRMLLLSREEMKTTQVQFNNVPDSLFDTTLPPGTILWDVNTQTAYKIEANGKRTVDGRRSQHFNQFPLRWLFIACTTSAMTLTVFGLLRWLSIKRKPS